ncbi:MAG: hypothetical protein AB7U63_12375 [Porticoccaceae bacterium]
MSVARGFGGYTQTEGLAYFYNFGANGVQALQTDGAHTHSLSINQQPEHSHAITIDDAGGDGAHNNMQPTAFLHAHIKL